VLSLLSRTPLVRPCCSPLPPLSSAAVFSCVLVLRLPSLRPGAAFPSPSSWASFSSSSSWASPLPPSRGRLPLPLVLGLLLLLLVLGSPPSSSRGPSLPVRVPRSLPRLLLLLLVLRACLHSVGSGDALRQGAAPPHVCGSLICIWIEAVRCLWLRLALLGPPLRAIL